MENPSDLVFDTKLPVVPQYEHIFDDEENVQRLPAAVRESGMRVQLFDGALQQTRRILESDYKAAIPQYYNHSIQLLIPICLQNPGVPAPCPRLHENSGRYQISWQDMPDPSHGVPQRKAAGKTGYKLAAGMRSDAGRRHARFVKKCERTVISHVRLFKTLKWC